VVRLKRRGSRGSALQREGWFDESQTSPLCILALAAGGTLELTELTEPVWRGVEPLKSFEF